MCASVYMGDNILHIVLFPSQRKLGSVKASALAHYTHLIFKYRGFFLSKGTQNYLTSFPKVPESLGSTNNEKIFSSSFPMDKHFKKERKRRHIQRNFAVLVGATLLRFLAVQAEVGGVSINYQDFVDNVLHS